MILNRIKNIFNKYIEKEKLFESLYKDIDGYFISRMAKDKIGEKASEHLIYGELKFKGISKIYDNKRINHLINNAKVFYDLGSGSGKIVIATYLLLPNLQNAIGIELLEGLHNASINVKNRLKNELPDTDIEKINFINDNFFNVNFSDADIIFLHYPMKNADDMYIELEKKMKKELRNGAVVISGIRQLKDTDTFQLVDKTKALSSYGKTIIYYYIKI